MDDPNGFQIDLTLLAVYRDNSGWLATRLAGAALLFVLVVAAITLAWPGIESDRLLGVKLASSESDSYSRMQELWSRRQLREEHEKENRSFATKLLY